MKRDYMTSTSRSSGIPRVIGSSMLCFGALGVVWTVFLATEEPETLGAGAWLVLEMGVSALHLAAGAAAIRRHRSAPLLAGIYAGATILVGLLLLPPMCRPPPEAPEDRSPMMEGLDHMVTGLAIWAQVGLRVVWALIAAIAMNTTEARQGFRSGTEDDGGV